jgi:hypothetical protein
MTRKRWLIFAVAYLAMLAFGAARCYGDKPGLKLKRQADGSLLLVPDLPPGNRYRIAIAEPTPDGTKTWVTYAWVIGGDPDAGTYLLPYRLDGSTPGPTPEPRPEPGPQPNPQPLPVPDAKVTAVYLVHESGDSDPKTAAVRDAKAWKDALDGKAIRWLVSDDDALVAKLPNVTAKARTNGLPAVVVMYADGTAVAKDAPGTPEAMKALVEGLK